jgi:hypothetical protein
MIAGPETVALLLNVYISRRFRICLSGIIQTIKLNNANDSAIDRKALFRDLSTNH